MTANPERQNAKKGGRLERGEAPQRPPTTAAYQVSMATVYSEERLLIVAYQS